MELCLSNPILQIFETLCVSNSVLSLRAF